MIREKIDRTGLEIAVIGMAGRFPGAMNIDQFWDNLKKKVESITFFSDKELQEAGVNPEVLQNVNYVKAKGIVDDIEYFDALFFEYTPAEAEIMNPQFRIFHECVWEALENSGYAQDFYDRSIGLYAGASSSFYWEGFALLSGKSADLGDLGAINLTNKDFLATKISYKLNLKGPSVIVHTACSTSLVAIHLASRAVLSGECNIALAGGVSITIPQKSGYFYQEGMVMSPDGHCRAFDINAKGMVSGEGAGLVVLKLLKNAIADGDNIYAVIKGSALNNDGKRKVGYTAPSVKGQAEVIRTALAMARVVPESIGYIETHGTATKLGDTVEIEGLKLAFNTNEKCYCAIGSVKTNIGHLDAAAGVAGFIKTVMALKYKMIPPSLHFEKSNPEIDFDNSPFYVNTELKEWKNKKYPLRAGVSSFGIGGTNVNVILEEAPDIIRNENEEARAKRNFQLLLVSARTETALEKVSQNLEDYFAKNPGVCLRDAAYTLQVGRKAFNHRRMTVCSTVEEAVVATSLTSVTQYDNPPVVFMFPGLGAQYINMGLDIYRVEPEFRGAMDRCFDIIKPLVDFDLKNILYPSESSNYDPAILHHTVIAQLVIFVLEYALARLLMKWGIVPHAMIGYSFGEYAAACIAEVFSLEDALKIIINRGQLIETTDAGVMLTVPLNKEELEPLLSGNLSLAIDNGPSCIVSGSNAEIDIFESRMKERKLLCMRLQAAHAIHSKMMHPIAKEFAENVARCDLKKNKIPYISNVTGNWIDAEYALNPAYWARHLGNTVQFASGIRTLLKEPHVLFIEIGPGRDLTTLLSRYIDNNSEHKVLNLIRQPQKNIPDDFFLLKQAGRLWLWGVKIDWKQLYPGEKRFRLPLPTYPFERQRYWLESNPIKMEAALFSSRGQLLRKPDMADWFYIPSWKRTRLSATTLDTFSEQNSWLIFSDDWGLGIRLAQKLEEKKQRVIVVRMGSAFQKVNDFQYVLNPGRMHETGYESLFSELAQHNIFPSKIVHLWSVELQEQRANREPGLGDIEKTLELGYYSLLHIARVIGKHNYKQNIQFTLMTNNQFEVVDGDNIHPEKSIIIGPAKVIPLEYPNIKCRCIDIVLPAAEDLSYLHFSITDLLLEEIASTASEPTVALRGKHRWIQVFEPIRIEGGGGLPAKLKQKGVYLITGGLGGIGLELGEYLAKNVTARLILIGRSLFPAKDEWEEWLATHDETDVASRKIRKIRDMEALGAEVVIFCADVSNPAQMQEVFKQVLERFGRLDGVIHSAGLPDGRMIQLRTWEETEQILAPKIKGTLVLYHFLKDIKPDFFILCSALSAILPPIGQVAYCGANAFMDAMANHIFAVGGLFTVSINWDRWQKVGIALIAEDMHKKLTGEDLKMGITPGEGLEIFGRILCDRHPQVAISTWDIKSLLEQPNRMDVPSLGMGGEFGKESPAAEIKYNRPELESEYVAPGTEIEKVLADIWMNSFAFRPIGIYDDFFELGGDSLKAVMMVAKIHKKLEVKLSLEDILKNATIKQLAQKIKEAEKETFISIEPTEKKEYYELSYNQKRLWIIDQAELNRQAYHITDGVFLPFRLEAEPVKKTLNEIAARHESFRTFFETVNHEPVQRIAETVNISFKQIDISSSVGDEKQKQLEQVSAEDTRTPFDLSKPPLLRVVLVKLAEENFYMHFTMHHIISDGWSIEILNNEFKYIYERYKNVGEVGVELALEPLLLQYKDFAEWENKRLKDAAIQKESHQYWQKRLQKKLSPVALPVDYNEDTDSMRSASYRCVILGSPKDRLKRLVGDNNTSLFVVLLSLFYILLSRVSGQKDILVGIPASGREHISLQNIVGFFVNTVILDAYVDDEKHFLDFLREVDTDTMEALQHQGYPLELILDELKLKYPQINVFFNMLNLRDDNLQNDLTSLDPFHMEEGSDAKFDLTVYLLEYKNAVEISCNYRKSLFLPKTIVSLMDKYLNIVDFFTASPYKCLKEYEGMKHRGKRLSLKRQSNEEIRHGD